jgi:hypothetical protein
LIARRIVFIALITIFIILIISLSISLEFKIVNIDDERIVGNIIVEYKNE